MIKPSDASNIASILLNEKAYEKSALFPKSQPLSRLDTHPSVFDAGGVMLVDIIRAFSTAGFVR